MYYLSSINFTVSCVIHLFFIFSCLCGFVPVVLCQLSCAFVCTFEDIYSTFIFVLLFFFRFDLYLVYCHMHNIYNNKRIAKTVDSVLHVFGSTFCHIKSHSRILRWTDSALSKDVWSLCYAMRVQNFKML